MCKFYKSSLLVAFILFQLFYLHLDYVYGTTFSVTSTNDTGAGTLREKIGLAGQGDSIFFDASLNGSSIYLASQLEVTGTLRIFGNGSLNTILNGDTLTRIFHVSGSADLVLSNLQISNGWTSSGNGGGILNEGHLRCDTCLFNLNFSNQSGGAIYNTNYLYLQNCTLDSNYALLNSGGGIYSEIGTTVYIYYSTLSDNHAYETGGAIASSGNLQIYTSTLSRNYARLDGGAVFSEGSIYFVSSTIAFNLSSANGGGLQNFSGNCILINSILSNNTAYSSGNDGANAGGTLDVSCNHNIIGDNVGFNLFAGSGNQLNVDPHIAYYVADNGGLSETYALLCGSPAIDAGFVNISGDPDQRGEPRSLICDIGAYEFTDINTDIILGSNGETLSAVQIGTQYQWFDCNSNSNIAGQTASSFTATANGSYALIISNNGCTDSSDCVNITSVGIDDRNFMDGIELFPNPVRSELEIKATSFQIESVEILNLAGQILQCKMKGDTDELYFDTSELPAGIYIAKIKLPKFITRIKFVKL